MGERVHVYKDTTLDPNTCESGFVHLEDVAGGKSSGFGFKWYNDDHILDTNGFVVPK